VVVSSFGSRTGAFGKKRARGSGECQPHVNVHLFLSLRSKISHFAYSRFL
jgi:hypothetical protein